MPVIQSFTTYPPQPKSAPIGLSVGIGGAMAGHNTTADAMRLRLSVRGQMSGSVKFALQTPAPILNELAAGAFSNRYYAARLRDNFGNSLSIARARIEAPAGQVGKRVSIQVADFDLDKISPDKTYTFEIGTRESVTGAITWETVIENAPLLSRDFSEAWLNDSLSFGAAEPLKNRLNRYPLKNWIYYYSGRTQINISEIDKITVAGSNEYVQTETRELPRLDLYKILNFIKTFCGFDAIETNIPNFEINRFDLTITQTYLESLAGIIGAFSPVFFTVGNTLYILDKTAAIPDDFDPEPVTAADFSDWSVSIPEAQPIDGVLVSFVDSDAQADYSTDRLVQTREETGTFGASDYTRTEITRTYRDWFLTEQPDNPLRTELVREVHSTYNNSLELIGRETSNHIYDAQGKRTNTHREIESLVPDLDNSGTPALLTVREETQSVFYTTDARNSRRQFQSKIITQISGLISVDSENPYFDADFKQDFIEAHKSGNLTASMTSEFGLLKTVTETLTPLGNNQFEVRTQTTDHLRNATVNAISEPKTGDASLNSIGGRQRQVLVLKGGLTLTNRPGGRIETFSGGEIPLEILIPLVERIILRREQRKQSGRLTINGYSASLDRGTFFTVTNRAGASYGKFLTEGYAVDIEPLGDGVSCATVADVSQI